MIKLFRNVRQNLLSGGKTSKPALPAGRYLKYAIGEIILVVIGILIALQVNNWNEQRKQRNKELHYLTNLKTDLNLNIAEIDRYIANRDSQTASAQKTLEYYDGKPLTDYDSFNRDIVNVYTWQKFFQIDNTYQELTNSGNLSLITNDSIKNGLLNLETLYKKLKYEEEHFRYDSEVMLYEPSYGMLDINALIKNYTYQVTNGNQGEPIELPKSNYEALLKDLKQKNGFAMATYEFPFMNGQLKEMKTMCQKIISLIDQELAKE
jgi:hypothetical protein